VPGCSWMAKQHVSGLAAIHLNLPISFPPPPPPPEAIQMQNSQRLLNSASTGSDGAATFDSEPAQTLGTVLPIHRLGKQCGIREFQAWRTTKVIPRRRSRSIHVG